MNPIRESLRQGLVATGGIAVLFEVQLRKLCEKYPVSRRFAYGDLERDVLKGVRELFQTHLTDNEVRLLTGSVRLRNKIVHGQFQLLDDILEREFQIESKNVLRGVPIPADPATVLDTFDALIAGEVGEKVRKQHQKKEAGTYAWELQAAVSGALSSSTEILGRAVDLMDRLVTIEDP